jgi:diadenosine tetraphosphate (Ap4A) HIT family hydrolase
MKRESDCVFCREDFTSDYQLVSAEPNYWNFLLNRDPQCDYHCLIVLKTEAVEKFGHIGDLGDCRLPDKVMKEFGILLKKACISIKACDSNFEKVLLVSLNTGEGSQHLHFHLLPKRIEEQIKTVNDPTKDGGGMFFLARKEIIIDTFSDFLKSTTGCASGKLMNNIKEATKEKVAGNAENLKNHFKWCLSPR